MVRTLIKIRSSVDDLCRRNARNTITELLAVTLVEQHTGAQRTHGVQTTLETLARRLVRRRLVEVAAAIRFDSSAQFCTCTSCTSIRRLIQLQLQAAWNCFAAYLRNEVNSCGEAASRSVNASIDAGNRFSMPYASCREPNASMDCWVL